MKAIICGLLKYPNGDAGSIRQSKLAEMLRRLDYEVLVVGLGEYTKLNIIESDSIPYISLRGEKSDKLHKIFDYIKYWYKLKKIMVKYKPDVVLIDDIGVIRTIQMKKYCSTNRIILVHDSVEWYSPEQFKFGKFSWAYISKNIINTQLINSNCRVIAISKYLENHFSSKGIECIRIPIVLSSRDFNRRKNTKADKVCFTYAGQIGKKDYIQTILKSFSLLSRETLNKVEINIVGSSREDVLKLGVENSVLDKINDVITFFGKIENSKVIKLLEKTDFTLLIRDPSKRYAKAGFPSKMVESLSNSTPLVCNLTSDMDEYLQNNKNALIADNFEEHTVAEVLKKAISMNYESRCEMYTNAIKTAEENFTLDRYLRSLAKIVNS